MALLPSLAVCWTGNAYAGAGVDLTTRPSVTIITHGYNSTALTPDGWLSKQVGASRARMSGNPAESQGGDVPVYVLSIKRKSTDSESVDYTNVEIDWPSTDTLPPRLPTLKNSLIIKVDWSNADAGVWISNVVPSTKIAALIESYLLGTPFLELPIHLVGHSRGGSVMLALAQLLGERGIWVEQLTTLDPHPIASDYQGGGSVLSATLSIPGNVIFADSYRQTDGLDWLDNPNGYCLNGALNVDLSSRVQGPIAPGILANPHSKIHAWYYYTTNLDALNPDVDGVSLDPGWFSGNERYYTGYNFSRDKAGVSVWKTLPSNQCVPGGIGVAPTIASRGLHHEIDATEAADNRIQVPVTAEPRPSILIDNVLNTGFSFAGLPAIRVGDQLKVHAYYRAPVNSADIVVDFDDDMNPFNDTQPPASGSCQSLGPLNALTVDPTDTANQTMRDTTLQVVLNSANIPNGISCFVRTTIKDKNNSSQRIDYARRPVVVMAASANTAPSFAVGDGKVTTDFGTIYDYGRSVTVQADGKILVAGASGYNSNTDFAFARYNADGHLDASFGTGGKVTTDFFGGWDWGASVILQPDGKILVAGSSEISVSNSIYPNRNFAIARYKADGSLDASFGTGGKVTTDFGGVNDSGNSATLQADGKILVAGFYASIGGGGGTPSDFALARYNADGSLDANFGSGGQVTTTFLWGQDTFGRGVTVQPDGKILVVGTWSNDFALARYNIDGSLDNKITTSFTASLGGASGYGSSVTVQSDGKILAAGSSNSLVRYNTNLSLDTSFGTDGKATTAFRSDSITLQADGKILAAGCGRGNNQCAFGLARYNTDGRLDTSFDGDGKVTTNFGTNSASGASVTTQADGKILVAGTYSAPCCYGGGDFALARYNTDGSLDASFGYFTNTLNGTLTYTEGGSAVVLDSDVQIYDAQLAASGNYGGASLTLARNGGASAQDVFSNSGTLDALTQGGNLTVGGITIGTITTNSGGTLTLMFNSSATQNLVNSALRQITYSNSSSAPPASVQIDWTFNDGNTGAQGTGGALAITGSTTVNIMAVHAISLSTTSLTFDARNIGNTSAAQVVTLTNTGSGTLNISSIAASGDFARSTTCGATLAAGANCTIDVTFTAAAVSARTGAIIITSDAASSPDSVTLSGDGVAPPVTTFTASATAGANGSITPASQTVTQGDTASFTVTPDTGYTASASGCGGSLNGGIYTTGAITADCTVSATFTPSTIQASLALGWNLLGNSTDAPLGVPAILGDATKVITVWKWIPATSKWAFYAPSMTAPNLATYAAGKGYDILTTINGGEGFWVNAKTAFTVQLPAGAAVTTISFQDQADPAQNKLLKGWNLVAMGDNVTPSVFNHWLSVTPPAQGVIPLNVTTLWAWDSGLSNWYFYAPSLEASGTLTNYIASKNYLDFGAKALDPAMGFWVNKP